MTLSEFKANVQIQQNGKAVKSNKFTVQFYNSTTYWITFINSTSLNENSLNIGFQPGTITDLFGNHLTVNEVEEEYEG